MLRLVRQPAAVLLMAAGVLAGCATNPATGSSEFTLMSEAQEINLGKELDAEVRREVRVYDDPELVRHVEQIGLRLAARSHRPGLPWHFTIVDQWTTSRGASVRFDPSARLKPAPSGPTALISTSCGRVTPGSRWRRAPAAPTSKRPRSPS